MHASGPLRTALDTPQRVVPRIGRKCLLGKATIDLADQAAVGTDEIEPEIWRGFGHGDSKIDDVIAFATMSRIAISLQMQSYAA
ncbi:hypothetical protein D3C77_704900 [compost metagenome]